MEISIGRFSRYSSNEGWWVMFFIGGIVFVEYFSLCCRLILKGNVIELGFGMG